MTSWPYQEGSHQQALECEERGGHLGRKEPSLCCCLAKASSVQQPLGCASDPQCKPPAGERQIQGNEFMSAFWQGELLIHTLPVLSTELLVAISRQLLLGTLESSSSTWGQEQSLQLAVCSCTSCTMVNPLVPCVLGGFFFLVELLAEASDWLSLQAVIVLVESSRTWERSIQCTMCLSLTSQPLTFHCSRGYICTATISPFRALLRSLIPEM